MTMEYKNPVLYKRLKEAFGEVKVQNRGQDFKYKAVPKKNGHLEICKIRSGEEYAVCCPKCTDTRFRLNVNHVFGTRVCGVLMDHVAHCWNEDCDILEDIKNVIAGEHVEVETTPVVGRVTRDEIAMESNSGYLKLDNLIRIDQLMPAHPAREYLIGRGLNPDELGRVYGVMFCNAFGKEIPYASNRIIYPLYHNSEQGMYMVGWQAGVVPGYSHKQKPKYYTSPGCMRSFFMYMFPWTVRHNSLVLVEGAVDAHTIGEPACALLGRNLTDSQASLIVDTMQRKSGPVVMVGDVGFEKDWGENKEKIERELGKDRVVLLVPEDDANALGRNEIHRRIRDACKSKRLPSPV